MKKHLQAFMPPREAPFIKRAAVWIVLVGAGAIIAGLLLFTLMVAIFSIALPDVRNSIAELRFYRENVFRQAGDACS